MVQVHGIGLIVIEPFFPCFFFFSLFIVGILKKNTAIIDKITMMVSFKR